MSHLEQRIDVVCPLAQAAMRIGHFFGEAGAVGLSKLTLRLDVHVPGVAAALSLRRAVVATLRRNHLPGDMVPRYAVEWAPEEPGPFPDFAGELVVEGGSDYDSFSLRLSGDYTPPLGLVGKGFDFAVGNRVARATANELLEQMRDRIEAAFRADEARKPKPVPLADPL